MSLLFNKLMTKKIVITGAAGLVGQNLINLVKNRVRMRGDSQTATSTAIGDDHQQSNLAQDLSASEDSYSPEQYEIIAIDKNRNNLELLARLNPNIRTVLANLARPGEWEQEFEDADCLAMLHAHITGTTEEPFTENNIKASELVLKACHRFKVPKIVHISSSVVNSVAEDWYTNTKLAQEELVKNSGIPYTILRPTLMFGWFDPKHLGWLSRFMQRVPVFPIPGRGRFIRQPLYALDFCRVIEKLIDEPANNQIYDIVGQEDILYVDLIREIKQLVNARAIILPLPYSIFAALLRVYALMVRNPPFTADQLKALVAGDYFSGVDLREKFSIEPTPVKSALKQTFTDPRYSKLVLEKT